MPINPNPPSLSSGDKTVVSYSPDNYTPVVEEHTDSINQLTAHLYGIDAALGEGVQDAIGSMLSSNVETGIALTYDDTNGKIDAYVDPYDVVGGRLDLVSATSIKWGFQNSNHIRLFNPTSGQWELVKLSAEPTLANTANDLNGTALVPNTIYDIFAEYSSPTAFSLVASRWSYGGDGANNSGTTTCVPTMTADNAPGPLTASTNITMYSGAAAYGAFNSNNAVSWLGTNGVTAGTLTLDFGAGNSICINKYSLKTSSPGTRGPSAWTIKASNDNSNWTTLDTRSSVTFADNAWMPSASTYYTFSNLKSYRYYQLNVTANGGDAYLQVDELKYIASPTSLPGSSTRIAPYESTVTYAIGDRVTYGGHDWVKISTAAAGTTPVAGAAWVDNGTSVSGDFAGLYRHDGVLVSDSSTTGKSRRWLGIIYTYNNSGTVNFKDDVNYRFVSNFYNKVNKLVKSNNTTASWSYNGETIREFNNSTGQARGNYILTNSATLDIVGIASLYYASTPTWYRLAWGINSTSSMATLSEAYVGTPNVNIAVVFKAGPAVANGYNYITMLEKSCLAQSVTVDGTTVSGGFTIQS